MKTVNAFETSDGTLFSLKLEAEKHEMSLSKRSIIEDYLDSDLNAYTGHAQRGMANYAASKAGIIGFSKSIAKELGSRNIRTNVVAPGFIRTEMTDILDPKVVEGWAQAIPLKRAGETEDVANVCVFLASDMSAYVNGQVLSVCGGML
jgi:3-oxoacyl-[acyl-carrier protein] reductase